MSPVGAIFVQFPPKMGTNLVTSPPPPQSLNGSRGGGGRGARRGANFA